MEELGGRLSAQDQGYGVQHLHVLGEIGVQDPFQRDQAAPDQVELGGSQVIDQGIVEGLRSQGADQVQERGVGGQQQQRPFQGVEGRQ
ncbi:MAG TPA: hypothetical protein DD417_03380 [Elusimicrobia bacterium]|nr:hypothetical protein [Elusimicrobiota bacterium]